MNGSRLPKLWVLAAILKHSFSEGRRAKIARRLGSLISSIAIRNCLVVHSDSKPFPLHIVFPRGG